MLKYWSILNNPLLKDEPCHRTPWQGTLESDGPAYWYLRPDDSMLPTILVNETELFKTEEEANEAYMKAEMTRVIKLYNRYIEAHKNLKKFMEQCH